MTFSGELNRHKTGSPQSSPFKNEFEDFSTIILNLAPLNGAKALSFRSIFGVRIKFKFPFALWQPIIISFLTA